jgi:hypothetical protein
MRRPAVVIVALALAACGPERADAPQPRGSPPPVQTEAPPPTEVRQWVAVFDTAEHPDDLDPSTKELLETAAENIAVQPVQCWEGLAADLDVDAGLYAAAVIAPTEEELQAVVEDVGREPVGTGRYKAFCID